MPNIHSKTAGFPNKRRRSLLIFLALMAVLSGFLLLIGPATPDGSYVAKGLATEDDVYWLFSDGRVSLVFQNSRDDNFGTYRKTNDVWLWVNDRAASKPIILRIEVTWAGLRFCDESGQELEFIRRRVLPFIRPSWVPDFIE